MSPSDWFKPDDKAALTDLFAVYDTHVNFAEVLRLAAIEDPAFAEVAAAMRAAWKSDTTARDKREVLRRAMTEGEWPAYESEIKGEAVAYATHGVRDWQLLTRIVARELTPHIVTKFVSEPLRLANVLLALHGFLDRVNLTLGNAYVARRESMIHEVEQRSRRMIESASVGLWVCDPTGKTTFMNQHLANMLGITTEEGLSTPIGKFMEKRDRDELAPKMEDRKRGRGESYEQKYIRKDKSTGWALLETGPLTNAEGKFDGVITMVTDITARKEAEERLHRSEARYRRLADSGLIGVITLSQTGAVLDANAAITKIVGYTREELTNGSVHWPSLTPPEYNTLDLHAAEQLRVTSTSTTREKEYIRKDGTRVPVLVGVARLENTDEYVQFVLDLTERKRAEEQVARLRLQHAHDAKFRALLEAAPDAMVIVDERGIIEIVNAQTENLFGHVRDELLGKGIDMLIPEGLQLKEAAVAATATIGGNLDLIGRRKDGREIPIDVSLGPLQMEDGRVLVSTSIRDITDRRRIEMALRLANHELEAFSYSVAHDLRAPLRGMNGFAKILLEDYADKLDAQGARHLEQICANAMRMAELIDALLALAQVTRSQIHVKPVDLAVLAKTVFQDLEEQRLTRESPAELIVLGSMPLECEVDEALVRTLLDNLLGNALKFTAKRAVSKIEMGRVSPAQGAAFFIRDNGAGFDMAHAKKLFEPFQRLHSAREYAGTGIGLATARRIVERHGGRIWAESSPDKGATFFFSFPATRSFARGKTEETDSPDSTTKAMITTA